MNKFENTLEIIGQSLFEALGPSDGENAVIWQEVNMFVDLAKNSYAIVTWPESQEYMEEDWFEDEAILDTDGKFGSSAYFIPIKRILNKD